MTPERAQQIVDELRGTCKSIDECLEDGEDALDQTLTGAIDDALFLCDECGWWCEQGAQSSDAKHEGLDVCSDHEDGDDDC